MISVAYYLGQFHPIPENNKFWGEGFTEWHNVAKARALYPTHIQPVLPGRFGFYDLRNQDSLVDQIEYASYIGIDAFCHWHYWFAGKRILHSPLDAMLKLGTRKFKFMLGWANESWSGVWHGHSNQILIEQKYDDAEVASHARLINDYIDSNQYIEINGKYPFVIYKPKQIPDPVLYLAKLRQHLYDLSRRELYIIGNWSPGRTGEISKPEDFGLDAVVITPVAALYSTRIGQNANAAVWKLLRKIGAGPEIRNYKNVSTVQRLAHSKIVGQVHSTIVTGWDNTPRSGRRGLVLRNFDRNSFSTAVNDAFALESESGNKNKIIFLKSWNEWAEGNVIEPKYKESWSVGEVLKGVLNATSSE